ncbi:hypothetical protein B0I32_1812 [Nonomuraea fuscirosea]|uniref:Uncharacterized protein n=1 Tax=Nonomuraea fuscirosea TaxID=1291556 RepID=A0A2T0LFE9_9ACTN|nr:hypothetical protein B0I32_1812 [Nonomuraea fuscirosea]
MARTQCAFIDAAKAAGVPRIEKGSRKEAGVGFNLGSFHGTREHAEIERYLEASRTGLATYAPAHSCCSTCPAP